MARKLLIAWLFLSLLLELGISLAPIVAPDMGLQLFKLSRTQDTLFLSFVVGWLCLFVSLICILLIYRVWKKKGDYTVLGYLLGLWWIGIGVAIFIAFRKPDNLWMDSLKGLVLVILVNRARGRSAAGRHSSDGNA